MEPGIQRFRLGPGQMSFPKNLLLESIEPTVVEIRVSQSASDQTPLDNPGN